MHFRQRLDKEVAGKEQKKKAEKEHRRGAKKEERPGEAKTRDQIVKRQKRDL